MFVVRRPTPTTVLYTTSTRAQAETLTAQLLRCLFVLPRLVIAGFVAAVLLAEYRTSWSGSHMADTAVGFEQAFLTLPFGQPAIHLMSNLDRTWRLLLCATLAWLISRKGYTEESLLVIQGLGVQTSTSSSSYLWSSSTRFIPTTSIQDIFIHEAFKGYEVRYYLMIVVAKEDDVVVVFPNILPRREVLEDVWRGARSCLYELK